MAANFNEYESLLKEFRVAWCDFGSAYHMIEVHAPSRFDTSSLPFDQEKYDIIASACLPVVRDQPVMPNMSNSTMHGVAILEKRNNQGAAECIRELFNRAGAALPLQFHPVVRGLCPWYMSASATRWLALLLITTGTTARDALGQYSEMEILENPLELSIQAIQAYRLNSDEPIVELDCAAMPVFTGRLDKGKRRKTPANGPKKRPKPKGDGNPKSLIIAALNKHHQYSNGRCEYVSPAGVNQLARQLKLSSSTVSIFFETEFGGHDKYKRACSDTQTLAKAFVIMNGELTPRILYHSLGDNDGILPDE